MDDFSPAVACLASLNGRHLLGRIVDEPPSEHRAVRAGDVDRIAHLEITLAGGDSGRQEALAAADQRFVRAGINENRTTRRSGEGYPKLARWSPPGTRREIRSDRQSAQDIGDHVRAPRVRDHDTDSR